MPIARAVPVYIFRRKARPFACRFPAVFDTCDECHVSMPFRGHHNQSAEDKLVSDQCRAVQCRHGSSSWTVFERGREWLNGSLDVSPCPTNSVYERQPAQKH